jgi:hypothetical protein
VAVEEVGHEIGMRLGTAEAYALVPASQAVLFKGIPSACFRGNGGGKLGHVELGAAPRNVPVIDIVRNAEIVKWTQMSAFYSQMDAGLEDEVLLAQPEEIGSVAPLWRRR